MTDFAAPPLVPPPSPDKPAPPSSPDDAGPPPPLAAALSADLTMTFASRTADENAGLSSWQLARRLPRLLGQVFALAWAAGRSATATVLVLRAGSGCLAALGLLAARNVLVQLFVQGPSPERIRAALPALLLMAVLYLVHGALDAGADQAGAVLFPAVRRLVESRLCRSAVEVELAAFDDAEWHDNLSRVKERGVRHAPLVVEQLCELTGSATALLGAAVVLGVLHPLLVPLLAAAMAPKAWGTLRAARLGQASDIALWAVRRRQRMLTDPLTDRDSAAEIRACTARDALLGSHRLLAAAAEQEEVTAGRAQARATAAGRALSGVGVAGGYVALGALLADGDLPLASAGIAVFANRAAQAALTRAVTGLCDLLEYGVHVTEYTRFVADSAARSYLRPGLPCPDGFRQIQVRNLTFNYPGAGAVPAVRDVSCTIRRGEVIALVGENGSGKSTLAKLLAGLYQPQHGSISWDGQDIAGFDPHSLHERISVVIQLPVRWPTSARDNITIGRHDRSDPDHEAVTSAATTAGAHSVIEPLPHGYGTLLTKRFAHGCDLSGGQWQRIAVARGYFRDAQLLFFDEPTSSMDARAEAQVFEHIRGLAGDRTIVLITHRLANARHCDRILVLRHGRLVEQGTHDELLRHGQEYAQMYALQRTANAEPGHSHEGRTA
ncbi:ATP-binding cassette domain-containing protein [Kitasatospora sp. MAP5-34]|uniref:ABC transporter ATP-binding protein n=1 Tax=Kitasatospora sp. MAP5-34 TaxID=3035102 RepID=UPI0024732AC2|nr:ATP-binding cassette domain-containing protein [Kitasatospora sp. MAP5-34]MDH6574651.1 ATP-binding cassette subfamily B protein [Kitasatospora sp. MAP5-34]